MDHQEYVRRHKPKDGEVFHVNYNWYNTMKEVKHSLTEGVSVSGEQALENWTKAFCWIDSMGCSKQSLAYQAGRSEAKTVMEGVDRIELYRYLMEDCDYGTAVEEMLRNLLTGMDPMAVRNALNEILEEDGFGVAQFKSKPDDPKKANLFR